MAVVVGRVALVVLRRAEEAALASLALAATQRHPMVARGLTGALLAERQILAREAAADNYRRLPALLLLPDFKVFWVVREAVLEMAKLQGMVMAMEGREDKRG
jgi:hypothetical protein